MSKMKTAPLLIISSVLLLHKFALVSPFQTPKSNIINVPKTPSFLQVAGIYAVAPSVPAVVLPILTDTFRMSQSSDDLLKVLVAKRAFLYVLATIATVYAGWRASSSSSPAGESLDALNREILKGEASSQNRGEDIEESEKTTKQREEKEGEAVFAVLDEVDGVNQNFALALPLFLTVALSISYFLSQGPTTSDITLTNNMNLDVFALFGQLTTVSNLVVCLLFAAAEYRSWTPQTSDVTENDSEEKVEFESPQKIVASILALISVAAASFLPLSQAWPFQNSVNIALAVTVTRALAPFLLEETGSIRTIALALTGLATYDAFSVFGTSFLTVPPAGALDVETIHQTVTNTFSSAIASETLGVETSSIVVGAGDASVMETVARSKLEGPWRPGLLEMVLVGRVSDVIGLGDIVFPASLVSWGFQSNMAYAYASIGGYVLGSLMTEVASTFGPTQGLPALIFLTPAMLGSVSLVAIQRGEWDQVWKGRTDR